MLNQQLSTTIIDAFCPTCRSYGVEVHLGPPDARRVFQVSAVCWACGADLSNELKVEMDEIAASLSKGVGLGAEAPARRR